MYSKIRSGCSGLLLCALILALNSCGGTQTFTVGDGKGQATVSSDNNGNATIRANGPDGTSTVNMTTGNNAVYPKEMPFPQYPSSKITFSMSSDNKQTATTANLETSDSIDKVISFYKNWFGSNSWKIQMENIISGGIGTITAQSGSQTVSVMAMPPTNGAATTIQIMISSDQNK